MSAGISSSLTSVYTIEVDQTTGELKSPIKVGGELTIDHIKFGDDKMTPFITAIQSIATLTTIRLRCLPKSSDNGDLIAYFEGTDSLVTTLTLGRCAILTESDHALADFLEKIPSATRLVLGSNLTGPECAPAIAHTLRTNTTLTAFEMLSKVADLRCILGGLKANLTLTSFALTSEVEDDGIESIVEIFKSNSNFTTLGLRNNLFEVRGLQALVNLIETTTSLTSLDLSNNGIGPEGAEHLAGALAKSPSLTHLDLSKNELEYNGCELIAGALKTNTVLLSLVLSDTLNGTPFGHEGAKAMVEALKVNATLTHLDMSHNHGTGNTYAELKLLAINGTLKSLNISATNVDHWGFEELCRSYENNLSLNALDLSLNEEKKNERGHLVKINEQLDRNSLSEKNRHTDLFSLLLNSCKELF